MSASEHNLRSQYFQDMLRESRTANAEAVIPIFEYQKAVECIDEFEQMNIAMSTEAAIIEAEYETLKGRVNELQIVCIKMEAERNAVMEVMKQLSQEIVNGSAIKNSKTQDNSGAI